MKTRQTFQQGYISDPLHTRQGLAFKIRYRVRTVDGQWKHKSETLYGVAGKKAARAVLESRLGDARKERPEAGAITFRDFVETYWKPYLDRRNVKPSTRKGYESVLNCHVLPIIGDRKLASIIPLHIEDILREKTKDRLSPKSVRNVLALLGVIFGLAEDNDVIDRTPVRKRHKPILRRSEKPIWTGEQVRSIIQNVNAIHQPLFVCAALTGARLGELLGLNWRHVDLSSDKLMIEQSLWSGQIVPPKTPGSIRTIPFGAILRDTFMQQRRTSKHTKPDDFVFCKPDGGPLQPDVLRKDVLYPALDRLGIPRSVRSAGFHTFRHSAGSFINAETGNLKLAQKLLGHSNLATTADTYTHTSVEAEREAAMAVERAIFGKSVPKVVPNREQVSNERVN